MQLLLNGCEARYGTSAALWMGILFCSFMKSAPGAPFPCLHNLTKPSRVTLQMQSMLPGAGDSSESDELVAGVQEEIFDFIGCSEALPNDIHSPRF